MDVPRHLRRLGIPKLLVVAISMLLFASSAAAEWTPPGDYSDTGRVIRTVSGRFELFDGRGCRLLLSEKLAAQLGGHVGEFVRIDYTRAEGGEGVFDVSGAPIVKIRHVTTLAKDVASLPVSITVKPLSDRVPLHEPVRVQITFTNRGKEPLLLDPTTCECHLLQDYRWVLSLEPELTSEPRRGKPQRIEPAGELVVTRDSAWMAQPGKYDIVVALQAQDQPFAFQSDMVAVTILPARDAAEETTALRAWLGRASPTQRVKIAERLLELGDDRGVDEVLGLLADRVGWGSYTYAPVYDFAWKHGGERGEKAMLAELGRLTRQADALSVIERVLRSPRANALIAGFLADRRATSADISGWCTAPRICDITAAWLVGYTDYEMQFPEGGSVAERNAGVTEVLRVLRETPQRFSCLR